MPNRPATTCDLGDAEELARGRVEADEPVGVRARLDEPQAILVIDRHAIGPRARAARHLPLLRLAGLGIEPSEKAARVIHVKDPVVGGHHESPRACLLTRHRDLPDHHGVRVDHPDLVGAEQAEPGPVVGVDHDAIRARA